VPDLRHLWARTLGDARICVAVLDGPVDISHPAFAAANLTPIEGLISNRDLRGPAARHGTHVASVIFGRHGSAVTGIAPGCRGLIIPVFANGDGGTIAACSQLDLARAISLAIEHGANIINISGGEIADSGAAHPMLARVIRDADARGVLIVAACGAHHSRESMIPGSLPEVLGVVAIDGDDDAPGDLLRVADFARKGVLLAPGSRILGAVPGGGTARQSGSSFAAPIVSGVAALLLSLRLQSGGTSDAMPIRAALLRAGWRNDRFQTHSTTARRDGGRLGAGRADVGGAIHLIQQGDCNMANLNAAENGHGGSEAIALDNRVLPIPEHAATANISDALDSATGFASPLSIGSAESTSIATGPAPRLDSTPSKASNCGCGCSAQPQFAYALGHVGYDFGTEARRDSIAQHMGADANPHDSAQWLGYLKDNPWDATAVIWTLSLDSTPLYAIRPAGPFAREICDRLQTFLHEQVNEGVERVSVPGRIAGKATLMSGQAIPAIEPDLRGMYSWTTAALTGAICGTAPSKSSRDAQRQHSQKVEVVHNFLERIYHECRNLGVSSQDRAINYAATNALNIGRVYEAAMKDEMDLDTIEVERSPVCRMDSDCWDVKLHFFFPQRQVQAVRKVYRFTVDVSDVVPVMVGKMRSWFVR
jgi:cyanobactin maturation PatA/PatG family protease